VTLIPPLAVSLVEGIVKSARCEHNALSIFIAIAQALDKDCRDDRGFYRLCFYAACFPRRFFSAIPPATPTPTA
jgi:hypothetical protein